MPNFEQLPTEQYFNNLKKQLSEYTSNRLQLLQLQLAEKIATVVAAMISGFIIAGVGFFVLLFMSLMGGYYFAQIFDSFFIGFGIVAAFYAAILVLLLLFKKQLFEGFVINNLLQIILRQDDEEQENKPTTNNENEQP